MKKLLIVFIIFFGVTNIAMSGGAFRLILPLLSDLVGYNMMNGELAYDLENEVAIIKIDGESQEVLTSDYSDNFRFKLHSLTELASESLTAGQVIYDDTNDELQFKRSNETATVQREIRICYILEVQSSDVDAGGSSAGWQKRNLNTTQGDTALINFDDTNDRFSFSEMGKYLIEGEAPAFLVGSHQISLYDAGLSQHVSGFEGGKEYANADQTRSSFSNVLAVTDTTKNYELWHYTQNSRSNDGLGRANGIDTTISSVYSRIKITKIK